MGLQQLLVPTAEYILALEETARETHRAEDRTRYERHLTSAALMTAAVIQGDASRLGELIASERHSYGWDYLDGEAGQRAESAFARYATKVEQQLARR